MPESLSGRPYLTCAEAATYCGFKTIGGIQQAVRRGKLKPAGRRGGTGTYVFAREDLDAFLTGGLQPHERLFVPPELNEAAAKAPGAESSSSSRRAPRRPVAQAAQPALRAQGPEPDRSPRPTPIHGAAAAKAAAQASGSKPGGKKSAGTGAGAGKKDQAPDPVARIMAALSGPTKKSGLKSATNKAAAGQAKTQNRAKLIEKSDRDTK